MDEKKPKYTIQGQLTIEQYDKFVAIKKKLSCESDSEAIRELVNKFEI